MPATTTTPRGRKKKTCIADFAEELAAEEATPKKPQGMQQTEIRRTMLIEALHPVVDLAHSQHKEVQRDAAAILASLSLNSDNQEVLEAAGSLRPLLMFATYRDRPVRRDAMTALARMTARESLLHRLIGMGALPTLLEALTSNDAVISRPSGECVANIAASSTARRQLVAAGGLAALATALRLKDPPSRKWALLSTERLATKGAPSKDDPEGDGFLEEILDEPKLIPALMSLLGAATKEEEQKLLVLRIVALVVANPPCSKRLATPANLPPLVALLVGDGAATRREAARTILTLGETPVNRAKLIDAGVLPPLLQLGRSEDVLLRQLTASILCELASEKSCKEELIRNGGPTRLLLGMARQIHRRVARPAMHALEELSELTDLAPLLIDAGAAPVLIALTASTDEHLGRWAASALAKLFTPRTTAALLRQGALGAIFVAATVPDRAMQLPASRVLLYLSTASVAAARHAARKGTVRFLASLLVSTDPEVLSNALAALLRTAEALDDPTPDIPRDSVGGTTTLALASMDMEPSPPATPPAGSPTEAIRGLKGEAPTLRAGPGAGAEASSCAELWKRLEGDGGRGAARVMTLAYLEDDVGKAARGILQHLCPSLLDHHAGEGETREDAKKRVEAKKKSALLFQALYRGAIARKALRALREKAARAEEMRKEALYAQGKTGRRSIAEGATDRLTAPRSPSARFRRSIAATAAASPPPRRGSVAGRASISGPGSARNRASMGGEGSNGGPRRNSTYAGANLR